jgi:hypothetical protein
MTSVCDLHFPPTYWAVSYAWDKDDGFVTLKCGGHNLTVQRTIHQLLLRLRKTDEKITLWIDAICINQADSNERSFQVEMMGQIYGSAEQVIAWVGEEDEDTYSLAQFLGRVQLTARIGHHQPELLSWDLSQNRSKLVQFLCRSWFTRTWVLQEVCLAQSCVLRCGSYVWQWRSLQCVFQYMLKVVVDNAADLDHLMLRGVIGF